MAETTFEGSEVFWHSTAHVLAMAVKDLFKAKNTIGPPVENGFYYDFDFGDYKLADKDLERIEQRMREIINKKMPFEKKDISLPDARKLFADNPYKLELAEEAAKEEKLSIYTTGDFVDLCRGPHLSNTGLISAIKLTKIAAAYWKGDATKQQLTRIYGVSFPKKEMMVDYLKLLEEAEKRDHRKIGRERDIFMTNELALAGSPFFLPKGTIIYNELLTFIRAEYVKRGYQEVITPLLYKKQLWEISGHWGHYKENMFCLHIGNEEYSLKPMNCPSHCLIYKNRVHSYRDLPMRIADFAVLHRNELGGVLGGLTRVTKFSQDDSHIFLAPEQIQTEITDLLNFIKYVYSIFKFEYKAKLSTRPDNFMGDPKQWDLAEAGLKEALEKNAIPFDIKPGEGAFYGPKIDFDIKDALGRPWQLSTIQLDFQMPQRFELTFEGQDGTKHTPVMIHRAILGSIERFMGVMTEYYAGRYPLWLSPIQVRVLAIADRHADYAYKVVNLLKEKGVRVEADISNETISKKVRNAQLEQVNYILVVGDKEVDEGTVTVRTREGKMNGAVPTETFVQQIQKEIEEKT